MALVRNRPFAMIALSFLWRKLRLPQIRFLPHPNPFPPETLFVDVCIERPGEVVQSWQSFARRSDKPNNVRSGQLPLNQESIDVH